MAGREETLGRRVVDFVQRHGLVSAGETLVVAVSGGADSVCLLHVLARWQGELGVQLHVAHLNHELRGAESDSDAAYVSELARQLGIPATIETGDVATYRREKGGSPEEAAREVRYGFLAGVAENTGASRVAVGHTRDDHIETILMHLLRGAGMSGLRGLQSRMLLQSGKGGGWTEVVRPLIEVARQETLDYCQRHELEPRTDSSNVSPSFLRNRVRLELLPVLRKYNPSIGRTLLRLASIVGDDVSFIEDEASRRWHEVATQDRGGIYLDAGKTCRQPRAMQRQIFRRAVAGLRGSLKDIEAEHIEAMMDFLSRPAGKELCLPGGLRLYTEYERLVLSAPETFSCPLPPLESEFAINVPGETRLPGWLVKAEVLQERFDGGDTGFVASLDLDRAGTELLVRRRRPGDRFQPLGMSQDKKVQDFMVDARIPRAWRQRVPLVCSPDQVLWVVGWRIDDRVKVAEGTNGVLRLEFKRLH